jgi:hypothetical protein
MVDKLSAEEIVNLVKRVFKPVEMDTGLAIVVDLPDAALPDSPDWRARREMAADWARMLQENRSQLGLTDVNLVWYPNVGGNNADLPSVCVPGDPDKVLHHVDDLDGLPAVPFATIFADHSMIMAPTELSATAPLKVAVREYEMRAATMPGFLASMLPALQIDYTEVGRRVDLLKTLLDPATGARVSFSVGDRTHELFLDLRHNQSHASGGLFPANGNAGNLPSGETYIVPYEGEREGDPSLTSGEIPVQFADEVVVYGIQNNRAREILSDGPHSAAEAEYIRNEPAYANLSELGLGVLGDFGLSPTGSILLDEKLGLHIAFGRSDHFGGSVSPDDFSSPDAVVHIDRVYIPEVQPLVTVDSLVLEGPQGDREIMRDNQWHEVF